MGRLARSSGIDGETKGRGDGANGDGLQRLGDEAAVQRLDVVGGVVVAAMGAATTGAAMGAMGCRIRGATGWT
ncbi:unnamed protein product [Closterium sp. NIES-54]